MGSGLPMNRSAAFNFPAAASVRPRPARARLPDMAHRGREAPGDLLAAGRAHLARAQREVIGFAGTASPLRHDMVCPRGTITCLVIAYSTAPSCPFGVPRRFDAATYVVRAANRSLFSMNSAAGLA